MTEQFKGARRELLEQLHALFLDALLSEFDQGNRTAAFLGVIRKFLRDNHCTVDMASSADLRASLEQLKSLALPFIKSTKKDTKQ